ncbi:hypothetical protein GD416_31470 [Burkholderia sp. BE24]|nr:hypothetical protein [Burkholderia sp. BE24]
MTDRRYVFQRPVEAARLHARRRYAVRRLTRRANARRHCLPPLRARGAATAAAARCAMPAQRPSSACHTENSRMTQFNRSPSRAAAAAARPSRHD